MGICTRCLLSVTNERNIQGISPLPFQKIGDVSIKAKYLKLYHYCWTFTFFFFFLAAPTAYGSSQARDGIQDAVAAHATAEATQDLLTH